MMSFIKKLLLYCIQIAFVAISTMLIEDWVHANYSLSHSYEKGIHYIAFFVLWFAIDRICRSAFTQTYR